MKIEISLKESYILIDYNGFKRKTNNLEYLRSLLYDDYGSLENIHKRGNDLVVNFLECSIIIKSIRNINKFPAGFIILEFLNSIKPSKSLKLIKSSKS